MSLELFSLSKSACCNAKCQIVLSRRGGFVTQNCIVCGDVRSISLKELPEMICPKCRKTLTKGYNNEKNYTYFCRDCSYYFVLAEIVPHWSEFFEENGFGLDSDFDENGNRKY